MENLIPLLLTMIPTLPMLRMDEPMSSTFQEEKSTFPLFHYLL